MKINRALHEIRDALGGKVQPISAKRLPLVTVCIPTRNEERYIGRALFAIQRINVYPRYEVIVVDSLSSDRTRDIAKTFGAKIIEDTHVGKLGLARHMCSLEARGEIIVQIDADTVLTPFILYKTVINLMKQELGIYHVSHYYYDANVLYNLAAHYYDKYFRKPYNTTGQFIAYTRELYGCVQFDINAALGEDYKFGEDVYRRFGSKIFKFDTNETILVSARGYKRRGLLREL
ncbi:MAG: glycosyltransferase family 2 protein, partial [Thermosphaera sp.]